MVREGKALQRGKGEGPDVLLVHPPVFDFTAFDFFLYPLGLVQGGRFFQNHGLGVALIDALDRYGELALPEGWKGPTFREDGCGHFCRTTIDPPSPLRGIPRRFHRFGLPKETLKQRMAAAGRPGAVAVTCGMTYWYLGAREVVRLARALWPGVPVLLGGPYATLCPEHARDRCEPDFVVQGRDLEPVLDLLRENNQGANLPQKGKGRGHDLLGPRESAAVQASFGCPRRCPYCAAYRLGGPYRQRKVDEVLEEISYLVEERGRSHIAFFDDALIEGDGAFFMELAQGLRALGLHHQATFHCPNALSASAITEAVARALKATRFQTLRIGFETADPALQRALGGKATNPELEAAMQHLRSAGYRPRDLGVYLLVGLPGQDEEGVEKSIRFVHEKGAQARLAEYAPVPGTPLFDEAKRRSRLDLDEPLNHNKTLAPFRFPDFGMDALRRLKDLTRRLNNKLLTP
jgi:hypothetical protein